MLRMAMRWLGFATARILPWRVIELKSDPIRVASPTIANPKLRVPTNTDREKVRERERELESPGGLSRFYAWEKKKRELEREKRELENCSSQDDFGGSLFEDGLKSTGPGDAVDVEPKSRSSREVVVLHLSVLGP